MDLTEAASQVWSRATAEQTPPEPGLVLFIAIVALLLVLFPTTWHWVRHLVTVVHEAGHAFVALLVGRRLSGIRLHSDTSGLTVSRGRPSGPGMVAMLAAGYLAPAVVGLGAATLLAAGHGLAVLWLLLLALVLMFVQIRNWYGALVLLVLGGGVFAITWYLSPVWQSAVAYAITWSLLLAAPKPVLELIGQRRSSRRTGSDADQLARHTPLPAGLWVAVFLVANLAGLAVGVTTLLPV
ncbi:M50 family metallopeptidase [Nocardioides sp. JQ2195]|uniref:M50 family metallopeptidase n=1 Tax=Nocardioides sp. JQ2195 TaxID=2592334 RepID=UPI00143E8510|nr:M50 family metallopeptidase [Nocardioides sp. JQ2195]QIX25290.1 M50 family metallopeptidase [Nocardioides sp. JQ2195]